MTVTLVVAVGSNGVIGRDGAMPWPRTGDQRQFRELTTGHPVVMGRATYESIGRPLPGRTSVVLTGDPAWAADGVVVARSLPEALAAGLALDDEVFVVGGARVYAEALATDVVDRLVVTHVPLAPEGDAHLAPVDPARWQEVGRTRHEGTPDYEVATYERRAPDASSRR